MTSLGAAAGRDVVLGGGGPNIRTVNNLFYPREEQRPQSSDEAGSARRKVVSLGSHFGGFVGRDALLAHLREVFDQEPVAPRGRVLCGTGGVGKTSLAVEYGYRNAHQYRVIWRINAERQSSWDAQFGELAKALGVPESSDNAYERVEAHLGRMDGRWLLILDNITDSTAADILMPRAGHGDVIITSQQLTWPDGWAVSVPMLDRTTAIGLLLANTKDQDEHAAGQLADELGSLPLALAQAAGFLRSTGWPVTAYLSLLKTDRIRMLARTTPGGKAVAGAWTAAIERLAFDNPSAVTLLRLFAFLAPDAIPVTRLLPPETRLWSGTPPKIAGQLRVVIHDRLAQAEALSGLTEYHLITPTEVGIVSVHRLIQAITRDAMPQDEQDAWRRTAAFLVSTALAHKPNDAISARDQCAIMLTHQEHIQGPDHPHTLSTRHNLAQWTGRAGDTISARDMLTALLPDRERILGPEHPHTLATRQGLAQWTGEAGDSTSAREMYATLVPAFERTQGPEHPKTLATRHNLAQWTGRVGNTVGARDMLAVLLPVCVRVLGSEHPSALTTRHNLAQWTGEAGDPATARDMYAALLPEREDALGREHPDTLATRSNFAWWTGNAGDPIAARDMYSTLLLDYERILGPEHPHAIAARSNLAWWAQETGADLGGL
ncbi:tetratricopeptide repeat protein [Actinospica durhamensis]|uniref:Tetratricopeptide repeat protein n=1 Tax=Actinospica durhamensis TaxID=1508375 RepID=A0A941IU35_9ACTN|nr:tetratricopeptide repeat protein [Actinospica durhamensis]MBR7835061.1 tetratricopeptide repeat protein [Actinospica durhamensis]